MNDRCIYRTENGATAVLIFLKIIILGWPFVGRVFVSVYRWIGL